MIWVEGPTNSLREEKLKLDVDSAASTGQAQGAGALTEAGQMIRPSQFTTPQAPPGSPTSSPTGEIPRGRRYKAAIALGNVPGHKNTKFSFLTMSLSQEWSLPPAGGHVFSKLLRSHPTKVSLWARGQDVQVTSNEINR